MTGNDAPFPVPTHGQPMGGGGVSTCERTTPSLRYDPDVGRPMALLRTIDDLFRRPWFGDAALLAACAAVLVAAAAMTPSTGELTLFGQPIPVMCTWRRLTGWSCPGCGLTRSFVFLAHGRLTEAFATNPLGPVGFAWVAAQIPWRIAKIRRRLRESVPPQG